MHYNCDLLEDKLVFLPSDSEQMKEIKPDPNSSQYS